MPATETNGDPHHFDFDLDRAIKEQVVEKLENSPLLALEKNVGPRSSGIYALYHQENPHPVYLGKASKGTTKSERTLRARLNEHVSKIRGVQGLNLADMQCRYLTLASEWWVFAAEYALIVHYNPAWNTTGFGSKVPGKGRPGTPERISKFYKLFPKA